MNNTYLQDLVTEITKMGFDVSDFTLNNINISLYNPSPIGTIHGSVTIARISTGKANTYATGNATKWIIDFSNDLKSGFFN